jgi:hypothetical protein
MSPTIERYTVTASAKKVDIHHFLSSLPQLRHWPMFSTDAGFYAAGSGLRRLPDTMSADIRELTGPAVASPVSATIRLAGNKWDLIAAMKSDFELRGNGLYTARGAINGSVHVLADTLSRIVSIFSKEGVSGSIIADALINGTISKPVISATVQSTHLNWRDILISKLWSRFTLQNKKLFIDTSFVTANGPIESALKGLAPGEFNGNAWVQARASGRLDSLSVNGDFQIGKCFFGRYHADTVSARCQYADQNLRWQSLNIKRDKSAMQTDGMVSWAKRNWALTAAGKLTSDNNTPGTFSTKARRIHDSVEASVTLENLDPVVISPWFPMARQLHGALGVHGTMAGAFENPDIRLLFSFDRAISGGPVLTTTGDLAFSNNKATAIMKFAQNNVEIPLIITAHIPVALRELSRGVAAMGDGAIVIMNGDSIAYGELINMFAPSVQSQGTISLHGTLLKTNGQWGLACSTYIVNKRLTVKRDKIKAARAILDLHIAGPLARPAARFTLSGDSIKYRGNIITAYSGSGSIVNEVLKLDTLHISASEGRAEVSGIIPVTLKNGFSFSKNSRISARLIAIPLGIVQPFMPDPVVINKGEISGQVVVEGTDKGLLQSAGTLSLRNGECSLYECDRPLGPMSVDLNFKNDSIILRRLQVNWGGGNIQGSGWATLGDRGISEAQSVIKCSDVRLGGCYENLDLGIQAADIILTKDSLFTIKVNALLADTRFTQDFSLIDIGERIKRKAPQTQKPLNPLFNNVLMRIAVNCNSNLTFDSNLGKMLIDGTLTAAGKPDKPSITGQFQILNGFVYYLDRKFTVTQGAIRQYDPQRINPSLDVTATSTVSWYTTQGGKEDYDITLLVKGDLSDPIITLSATPSLSQPQIISLLTLGTIQTGLGSDLGSRTGSLMSRELAGLGTRKLARFINVESVDLYGNVFGPDSAGPQLSVTKQVSSRVAVTYKKGMSKLSQQMMLISYRLLSFLYLEAETDQQAQGGVDLKFRYSR